MWNLKHGEMSFLKSGLYLYIIFSNVKMSFFSSLLIYLFDRDNLQTGGDQAGRAGAETEVPQTGRGDILQNVKIAE